MLKALPDSNNRFWENSDKHSVDVNSLKELMCTTHNFELQRDSRELKCKCGFTTRFTPTTIDYDETEGTVMYRGKKHYLLIPNYVQKEQNKEANY